MKNCSWNTLLGQTPRLALESVSCWNQQWSGKGKNYGHGHCGYCVPCLVRRSALMAAGIEIPSKHFDLDIRKLATKMRLSTEEQRKVGPYRALLGFVDRLRGCRSWKSFVREWPEVIETRPTFKPETADQWFRVLFNMMRKFAREVENAFTR